MKWLKYFIGSLIISFGILLIISIFLRAIETPVPDALAQYLLLIWLALAIILLPLAKKIMRA